MAYNALRLWNCEFGAEACGAAGLEMLLQRYRRFDRRCTIWDGTAQHCFFKLSRAFVGQEESYEQVQVCASALSFFADVCHGHVVMAPKSIIQQSKNLRTSKSKSFTKDSILRFLPLNCAMQGQACKLQQIYTASRQQNRFGSIWSSHQGFHWHFHESYPEANAGKPIVGAQVQDLQGRPLANIFGATLTAAKAEQSLVKLCS